MSRLRGLPVVDSVFSIRRSVDRAVIDRLQDECLPGSPCCEFDGAWWWVALCDGVPVGFGGYKWSSQFNDCVYLCRAGVLSKYRGHGIQRRLIRARLRHAIGNGAQWAVTDTTDNPRSANNLIACGFRLYTPGKPWAFGHSCYWRKKLV